MAAMMIHGLNPGPQPDDESPQFFYQIIAMLVIADMSKLIFGFVLIRPLIKILLVPRERLMPVVFVLCVVGCLRHHLARLRHLCHAGVRADWLRHA